MTEEWLFYVSVETGQVAPSPPSNPTRDDGGWDPLVLVGTGEVDKHILEATDLLMDCI
jgi:hypothetical protein